MTRRQIEAPEYLGDGVLAGNDGWHVELSLDGVPDSTPIYLEPAVMDRLIQYYERMKQRRGIEP
jgi:hypothetical protein